MNIRNAKDVGLLIRDRRRALGLDQQELARRVGATRAWVIQIEKGKPRAELALVLRTLTALGLVADVRDDHPGKTARPGTDIDAAIDAVRRKRG